MATVKRKDFRGVRTDMRRPNCYRQDEKEDSLEPSGPE